MSLTLLPEHPPPEPYYYVHGESTSTNKEEVEGKESDQNKADDEDDPILAALQADTSSEEDESASEDSDGPRLDRKKRPPDLNKYRSMTSTISVLALACWMLRIPIMYSDFIRYGVRPPVSFSTHDDLFPSTEQSKLMTCRTWMPLNTYHRQC